MKPQVAAFETRVYCLRIVPVQGTAIRLTNYPRDLVMSNGFRYESTVGYDFTDYQGTTTFSPSVVDLEGIAGFAGIGKDEVASGYFDNARCFLFATNWNNPVDNYEPVISCILGKTTLMDDKFRIEEMSLIDALNQTVGKNYEVNCQKTFGGQEFAGCKVDLTPLEVTGTVTALAGASGFEDSSRTEADNYFKEGLVWFTTGANTGLKKMEIRNSRQATGGILIYDSFYYPIAIGDQYKATPGCMKGLEHCKAWNNVVNFGGFSFIPTTSQYVERGDK